MIYDPLFKIIFNKKGFSTKKIKCDFEIKCDFFVLNPKNEIN